MNAEKRKQLDNFTRYVEQVALAAIKESKGLPVGNKDFSRLLLENKERTTFFDPSH